MKIVNRDQFLSMRKEVLYSKYEPCWFDSLSIKGTADNNNDFTCLSIADALECQSSEDFWETLKIAEQEGHSISMDFDCFARDGLFEDKQLFAVWEKQDVLLLIEKLENIVTNMEDINID